LTIQEWSPKEGGSWIPFFEDNQWCLSNVRVTLLHQVEGGNRRIRRFFLWGADPTEEFSTKITQELKIMKENSHIDKNTFDYLKPDKPKVGRFYLLPKIHKVNNPGRPIVSANGHPQKKSPNSSISTFDLM
jgi:hypothetical protein